MQGHEGGSTGIDNDFALRGFDSVGAWIMGRNMFGPVRDPWPPESDDSWKGWWGPNPPYHVPVFVLTNHPSPSLTMEGGTVFHFVTEGIHGALERATEAAGGQDIRLGDGVSTIRQYLTAGLVDELHLTIAPTCSVAAKTSSPASACLPSATPLPNTSPHPPSPTSSSPSSYNRRASALAGIILDITARTMS